MTQELSVSQRALAAVRESHLAPRTAAARHDVSIGSYNRAKRLLHHGIPEVIIAVENNEANLNWGDRVSRLPKEEQAELVQLLKPGYKKKTMMARTTLGDVDARRTSPQSPLRRPDSITPEVVVRATANLEALEMRLRGRVLDPTISSEHAKLLLAGLTRHGGAYRALRRMLTNRMEEGK